jgi:hypothetical protein
MFIPLLCISAFLVAGTAAYFSVVGIATLFSGSYNEVLVMAGSLELGKLVATSYLYRYWAETNKLLKSYLCIAVLILMGITSIGIFGYLSAAYQSTSLAYNQVNSKVEILEQQKQTFDNEIAQLTSRIETLNKSRLSQEQRLTTLSRQAAAPIYKDIEKAGEEIKTLTERTTELQNSKTEKDNAIIALKEEQSKVKDIGTFSFVAKSIEKPLDSVVTTFICILIGVFDPLAVALVLAFNVAIKKNQKNEEFDLSSLEELKKQEEARIENETNANRINNTRVDRL